MILYFQRVALRLLLLQFQPVHLSLLGPGLGPHHVGDDAGPEEGHHVAPEAPHHETDGSPDPGCHLGPQCHPGCSTGLQLLHDQPQQQVGNIFINIAN